MITPETMPPRRRQVYELTLEGKSEGQIGAEMNISPFTVRAHRREIYRQLSLYGEPGEGLVPALMAMEIRRLRAELEPHQRRERIRGLRDELTRLERQDREGRS